MPKLDGLKLSKEILKRNPGQLILLVSGYLNKKIAEKIAEIGVDYILEKPVEKENLLDTIDFMLFRRSEKTPITGKVQISLPTLLSVLGYEKGSAAIRVVSGSREGVIYIKDGYLIKSYFDGKKDIDALKEILNLDSYYYEQIPFNHPEEEINIPIEFILMESSRQLDEEKRENGKNNQVIEEAHTSTFENISRIVDEVFANAIENGGVFALQTEGKSLYIKGDRGEKFKDFLSIFSLYKTNIETLGFPKINDYIIINLSNGNVLLLILQSSFFAGFEINLKEMELGYILNVSIPELIEKIQVNIT